MNTIEFKTVSPLFEMERDGEKKFTTRKLTFEDERRAKLFPYQGEVYPIIKITNPANGESFERMVKHVSFVKWCRYPHWINIHW